MATAENMAKLIAEAIVRSSPMRHSTRPASTAPPAITAAERVTELLREQDLIA